MHEEHLSRQERQALNDGRGVDVGSFNKLLYEHSMWLCPSSVCKQRSSAVRWLSIGVLELVLLPLPCKDSAC